MKKSYSPAEVEARHYQRWEEAGYFRPQGDGEPYCIVIPPPNVTGTLHMGHAFQVTIMDALIRYHRMAGRRTLWQPGTDHAGISTQMVVERLLNKEGTDRRSIGREKFLERVWQWKDQSENTIGNQLRRMGASADWTRERFTMDAQLSEAVAEVFTRLYDEGLIYRGKRLVNWDPKLHTAVSDLEVLSSEEQGHLWRFRYPLSDGSGHLVVATTRPETMLGDTAVAVNPEDSRYTHLIGGSIELPLTGRQIPIVADDYVDPEFGTGCVKITPAHDFNDYEVGQRHDLPIINIFDDNAAINDNAPETYRGLNRFEARKRIVADLEAAGLLDGIDDHSSMIPRGDRSGEIVEPYLTDQWFVKAEPLARPAIEAVEDGRVEFVPENYSKTYFEWMRNIQDWCISRQLWWGHRIPAWYDDAGQVYVARDEAEVRTKYGLGPDVRLVQEEDVLDTWFSSALWPFSTMGWPAKTAELESFYPTTVLVTGFDIIFFWVARMIMMGLKFMGDVPFRKVYIHGLIRDHEGQKMSKTKGNIIDPLDVVKGVDLETLVAKRTQGMMQTHLKEKVEAQTRREFPEGIAAYGTDALRLNFAAIATTGRNLNLDLSRVEGYQRFCNKLWNASGFVFSQLDPESQAVPEPGTADLWIRSLMGRTIGEVQTSVENFRFDLAAQALYDFTWHEFCDWYLELSKAVLNDEAATAEAKAGARQTLSEVLGALLRLMHPLMPYVTEELWLELCRQTGRESATIMLEALPATSEFARNQKAETELDWVKAFVIGVRQVRGEMNIAANKKLSVFLADASKDDFALVDAHRERLQKLASLDSIEPLKTEASAGAAAAAVVGEMRVLVSLAGAIDIDAERERLEKQLEKAEANLAKVSAKLKNKNFVANAPASVVSTEHEREEELSQLTHKLRQQLTTLASLKG